MFGPLPRNKAARRMSKRERAFCYDTAVPFLLLIVFKAVYTSELWPFNSPKR